MVGKVEAGVGKELGVCGEEGLGKRGEKGGLLKNKISSKLKSILSRIK